MTPQPSFDSGDIQVKCEQFLKSLGVPGFIVFGWQNAGDDSEGPAQTQFGVVSSFHEMPVNAAIKGMTWALNDFVGRSL